MDRLRIQAWRRLGRFGGEWRLTLEENREYEAGFRVFLQNLGLVLVLLSSVICRFFGDGRVERIKCVQI